MLSTTSGRPTSGGQLGDARWVCGSSRPAHGTTQADGEGALTGEFLCKGEKGRWFTMDMHGESVSQGYAGSFCWTYHDNREDSAGKWSDA